MLSFGPTTDNRRAGRTQSLASPGSAKPPCGWRPTRARADALRARVERACGKQIQYRAREHADPTSDAVVLRPPGPAPATSVPEEALLEYKRRHYADWSDHPLPALNGMTPREAVRTAGGRAAVDNLLKEMENQEQRVPGAAFDFSELRRDLRLE